MSYIKAEHILPTELLQAIQQYVDGEYIYIPRVSDKKKSWGEKTSFRKELEKRNSQLYADYCQGYSTQELSEKYYLSIKSIQRIVLQEKKKIV